MDALVLEAVCIGVDGQFPGLGSTLYSRILACCLNLFVTVGTIYLAFRYA